MAVLDVARGDARVAFAGCVALEGEEAILPDGVEGTPVPSGQRCEALGSLISESTFTVSGALLLDPLPERVAILHITSRDARPLGIWRSSQSI